MNQPEEHALTDLLSFIVDNRGRTCPTAESGIPLIATNCIKDDELYPALEKVRFVDEATYSNWFRAHPAPGDIIFVCKGSPGRTALVPDPVPFCIAQDMVALRADPTKVDNRYLYYVLQSKDTRRKIENMHVGTMIPHFKKGDFHKLVLSIHPDLNYQRAVADVLSTLDNKITANSKIIAKIPGLLQAAFQSMVSDCESKVPFGEMASVTKGVSYKSINLEPSTTALVTLKSFVRTGGYSPRGLKEYSGPYKAAQVISPGEIVIAQTDLTQAAEVVGRAVRVPKSTKHSRLIASLDVSIVRPVQDIPTEFVLGVMQSGRFREHCKANTSGTTVLHLRRNAVESYLAPLVPSRIQQEYAAVARPLLDIVESLEVESTRLATLRDTLLPQLLSGKLRVRNAEDLVESVV